MNANGLIKIAIVGDYSIFLSALRMLIETDRRFKVVGEAFKFSDVSNLPATQKPNLILVDLPENDSNSDLFSAVLQSEENTPILVLTGSTNPKVYQKCLVSGINGLVVKHEGAAVLFRAIEKVQAGEYWFDRNLMGQTIKRLIKENQTLFEQPRITAHTGLSERENQVVSLICKGMKNKDIADNLFITETTVRHHLTSIFEKLNLTSRLELVIYAFKHNMVKIPSLSEQNGVRASKL